MTIEIPTTEPRTQNAGDTWKWTKSLSDYPATLFSLAYYLLGPTVFDTGSPINASASGTDFEIEVAKTKTAPLSGGEYTLVGYVTETATSERTKVYEEPLRVNPDAATLAAAVQKTHAETMFELVVAAIENRLTKDQENFQINGRAISRIPHEELRKMRGQYAVQISTERNPTSLPGPQVQVRF